MAKGRAHHLVPAFYLRRFANPKEQMIAYGRKTKEKFKTSTRRMPVQTGFYSVWDEHGQPSEVVEESIGTIEAKAAEILRSIDSGVFPPTGDDRVSLSYFLALQFVRGRDYRSTQEELADFLLRMDMAVNLSSQDPAQQHGMLEQVLGKKVSDKAAAKLLAFAVGDGDLTFAPPRNDMIAATFHAASVIAPYFFARSWHLIKSHQRAFLTSDRPVVLWKDPSPENAQMGLGIATADEIYFPLDPFTLLALSGHDDSLPATITATSDIIKATNTRIVRASYEWVFHHPKHDPLNGVYIPEFCKSGMSINGVPLNSPQIRDELRKFRQMGEALRRSHAPTDTNGLGETSSRE